MGDSFFFDLKKQLINNFAESSNEFCFITLTFNVQGRDSLLSAKSDFDKLKKKLIKSGFLLKPLEKNILYFNVWELGSVNQNWHIHWFLNRSFNAADQKKLKIYWNDLQNFPKSNNSSFVLKECKLNEHFNVQNKVNTIADFVNYMLKTYNSHDDLLELYTNAHPLSIFGYSSNLKSIINKLSTAFKQKLFGYNNLYFPSLKEEITVGNCLDLFRTKISLNKELSGILDKIRENPNKKDFGSRLELQIESEKLFYGSKIEDLNFYLLNSLDKSFKISYSLKFSALQKELNIVLSLFSKRHFGLHFLVFIFNELRCCCFFIFCLIKLFEKRESNSDENDKNSVLNFLHSDLLDSLTKELKSNLYRILKEDFLMKKSSFVKLQTFLESYKDVKIINEDFKFYEKLQEFVINWNLNNNLNLLSLGDSGFFRLNENINMFSVLSHTICEVAEKSGFYKKTDFFYCSIDLKNKQYFEIDHSLIDYLTTTSLRFKTKLPFLIQPRDLEIKDDGTFTGIFFTNELQQDVTIFTEGSSSLKGFISSENIDIINKLHNQSCTVDTLYLDWLLCLNIDTLKKLSDIDLSIFWCWDTLPASQRDIFKYRDGKVFLFSLLIAFTFKDYLEIWFLRFFDHRFRMYYKENPLSFHNLKILRPIFKISSVFKLHPIRNLVLLKKQLKIDEAKPYRNVSLLNSFQYALVGFDASSQSFQLLGAFLNSRKMLTLTNVLQKTNEWSLDFYEYILEKLLVLVNEYKEFFFSVFEKYKIFLLEQNQSDTLVEQPVAMWDSFLIRLNRKWIKKTLMTYGYNQSFIESANATLYDLFNGYFFINRLKPVVNKLTKVLFDLLNKEFPTLKSLKLLFIHLSWIGCSLKTGICIKYKTSNYFLQEYWKFRKVKSQRGIRLKKRNKNDVSVFKNITTYSYEVQLDPLDGKHLHDVKKSSIALLPNATHHADATLLFDVLSTLLSNNIPIFTVHDSFYSSLIYKNEVLLAYRKAFLLLYQNMLSNLIENVFEYWWTCSPLFLDIVQLLKLDIKTFQYDNVNFDIKKLSKSLKKYSNLNKNQKQLIKRLLSIITLYFEIKKNADLSFEDLQFEFQNKPNDKILN